MKKSDNDTPTAVANPRADTGLAAGRIRIDRNGRRVAKTPGLGTTGRCYKRRSPNRLRMETSPYHDAHFLSHKEYPQSRHL